VAAARFVRAFYEPERPPRDSVLAWYRRASSYETVRPVTGTVEALIVTGDLNLLRSDRARAAVSAYLDHSRRLVASQQTYEAEFLRASDALDEKIDYAETIPARVPQARIDSLARPTRCSRSRPARGGAPSRWTPTPCCATPARTSP
jgi:hypothetical protein